MFVTRCSMIFIVRQCSAVASKLDVLGVRATVKPGEFIVDLTFTAAVLYGSNSSWSPKLSKRQR
jgi:hypothetical protein